MKAKEALVTTPWTGGGTGLDDLYEPLLLTEYKITLYEDTAGATFAPGGTFDGTFQLDELELIDLEKDPKYVVKESKDPDKPPKDKPPKDKPLG